MQNTKVNHVQVSLGIDLAASILSAKLLNSQSLNVSINVCHVQGVPLPLSHSSRILQMMSSGSPWHSLLILITWLPVTSLRRNIPKFMYSEWTCWGILNKRSSGRVGAGSEETDMNFICTPLRILQYRYIVMGMWSVYYHTAGRRLWLFRSQRLMFSI